MSVVSFGGDLPMTNLDLALATLVALGLPFASAWLWQLTGGALASLVLYYLVCCVLLVRWRKGTLDYRRPVRWPWLILALGLLADATIAAVNWGNFAPSSAAPLGVALTALIWAPINAAIEQLSWLYVLDAWRNRWATGWQRWFGLAIGIVLIVTLVSLIHILFWTLFLPNSDLGGFAWVTITLNTLNTLFYALLYYRSRSMWPVFVVHLFADLQLVLLAGYSIIPSL